MTSVVRGCHFSIGLTVASLWQQQRGPDRSGLGTELCVGRSQVESDRQWGQPAGAAGADLLAGSCEPQHQPDGKASDRTSPKIESRVTEPIMPSFYLAG